MVTKTIQPKEPGQKPITYKPGGLHRSTSTPSGKPIPKEKFERALAGGFGARARKQALMAKNVFHVKK